MPLVYNQCYSQDNKKVKKVQVFSIVGDVIVDIQLPQISVEPQLNGL